MRLGKHRESIKNETDRGQALKIPLYDIGLGAQLEHDLS